jgi:menaquinone-dependent protoporphyrinogen oxidase
MKTLIAYVSKYGTTRECATRLQELLGPDAGLADLNEAPKTDVSGYDLVVIGSPVYMGKIQKGARNFCKKNCARLLEKRVAFFVCGFSEKDQAMKCLAGQVPEELLNKAAAIGHFGGEVRPEKAKFIDKVFLEKVQQDKTLHYEIDTAAIKAFCEALSGE